MPDVFLPGIRYRRDLLFRAYFVRTRGFGVFSLVILWSVGRHDSSDSRNIMRTCMPFQLYSLRGNMQNCAFSQGRALPFRRPHSGSVSAEATYEQEDNAQFTIIRDHCQFISRQDYVRVAVPCLMFLPLGSTPRASHINGVPNNRAQFVPACRPTWPCCWESGYSIFGIVYEIHWLKSDLILSRDRILWLLDPPIQRNRFQRNKLLL